VLKLKKNIISPIAIEHTHTLGEGKILTFSKKNERTETLIEALFF
jgi:hypothetical protein